MKLMKTTGPIMLGVVFGLFSIAFAYVVFMFCERLISSAGFAWLIKKAEEAKFFDFAILIAIFTFFAKEYLDSRRKFKEQERKLRACKVLLAEELRLNYYSQQALERIFRSAADDVDIELRPILEYEFSRGIEFFSVTDPLTGSGGATAIPKVSFKYYDRFVDVVAELDAVLFESMQLAYAEIREMEHIRNSLVNHLQAEEDDKYIPKDIRDSGFVDYAERTIARVYGPMNDFYFLCEGKALIKAQLR
ncbi:hypothetical protein LZV00_02915 [Pseudomonas kielensis]|uniref:hypothetical protein n=1 Tax=Pseudomonas kielensis TaxID=2762577 RepID=UPI00223F7F0E|nr:hypothetical protein [Pseudomonas kielensis]UZM14766.1 hypothetical protein LZV00_02915 [Pseudomonas kielensis]